MWIGWRKFTNGRWRFEYAMLFGTFCLMSLLTIALPNFVALEGLPRQTKQQAEEKPRADQTSSNRPEAGELTAEAEETTKRYSQQADYPRIDVDLSRQMLSVIDESGNVKKFCRSHQAAEGGTFPRAKGGWPLLPRDASGFIVKFQDGAKVRW